MVKVISCDNLRHVCPVCGYFTINEPYDRCEVCRWRHDPAQEIYPDDAGGPNRISLRQAQIAFADSKRLMASIDYEKDVNWKPLWEKRGMDMELLTAASDFDVPRMRALISAGADVNAQDYSGWTPLHYCVRRSARVSECLNLLLSAGADWRVISVDGWNPLKLAVSNNCAAAVKVLLEHMASEPSELERLLEEAEKFNFHEVATLLRVALNSFKSE